GYRRIAVPRAAQAGAGGLDHRRMEAEREQPSCEILLPDTVGPSAIKEGSSELEPAFFSHYPCCATRGGVEMSPKRWLYIVPLRLRSLFSRQQVDDELDKELQYHIAMKTEENEAKGMNPKEARRAALISLGGLDQR